MARKKKASTKKSDTKKKKKRKRKIKRNKKPKQKRRKKNKKKKKKTAAKAKKTVKAATSAMAAGTIGNLGKTITFQVSDKKILAFNGLSHTVKGRWASHARMGKKPLKQFLGPEAEGISLTVTLDAQHGVKPRTTAENIAKAVRAGTPQAFVVGGRKIGTYVIAEMSEAWERVMNKGEVMRITCSLTLEEYV